MTTYSVLHLFAGIGGAALGFQHARAQFRGVHGQFTTLAGIDNDPEACADFEMLTGAPAVCMDLFSRDDYIAFHGQEPPDGWREVTPADLRTITGGIAPDVVFLSPPCKGFSGLLPGRQAGSPKYQALNNLVPRGLRLTLDAFADDLPAIILFENVPRITSRGADLLREIKYLLRSRGYECSDGYHDCGEIGGLAQRRRRYLLIARLPGKVTAFVYQPPRLRVRAIGDVLSPLPLPDAPEGGPMHRLPRLQWKTWVRLALIPAGGDWRDLEAINPEQYRLEYIPRGGGPFGVQEWDKPAATVIGSASIKGSNAAAVADPRLPARDNRHPAVYRVVRFDEPAPRVTGTRFGSGAPAIADPRVGGGFSNKYQLLIWDEVASTVTGTPDIQSGAQSIADPRLSCICRAGLYGVQAWDKPGYTVTGARSLHSGTAAVADPRIPADDERPDPPPVIIAEDGTWHRPLTTYEMAMLQGFPTHITDRQPLTLAGNSDARWRERIGNAVPPPAARTIGMTILRALLLAAHGAWELSCTPVWVRPPLCTTLSMVEEAS